MREEGAGPTEGAPSPGTNSSGPSPGEVLGKALQLRDGTEVRIRPVARGDRARVLDFLAHLSPHSLELRYFSPVRRAYAASEILTTTDRANRLSLLLETIEPGRERVIAQGEFVRVADHPNRAEVAFLVADDLHGQGAATLLLWELARRAREAGIRRFEATVRPENRPMIDVFVGAGFPCSISWHEGEGSVQLDLAHEPAIAIALREPPTGHWLVSA
ncbi:MAG TPA: GNAT family N-acetyltransferase [Thermoplasmata archaeon]|nr:GNAT family N-acetyltransferase [Thermoplasmata archaeon]